MKMKNTFSRVLIMCGCILAVLEMGFAVLYGMNENIHSSDTRWVVIICILIAVITLISFYAAAQFLDFMYTIAKAQAKMAQLDKHDYEEEEKNN